MIGLDKLKAATGCPNSSKQRQVTKQSSRKRAKLANAKTSGAHQRFTGLTSTASTGYTLNQQLVTATATGSVGDPATVTDESMWIFGLINNIEQLLSSFTSPNQPASHTSTSSSGASTPSSTSSSSAGSSPGWLAGSHTHQLARSPVSRQIKFHEYKGPPSVKRQQQQQQQQQQQTSSKPVNQLVASSSSYPSSVARQPQALLCQAHPHQAHPEHLKKQQQQQQLMALQQQQSLIQQAPRLPSLANSPPKAQTTHLTSIHNQQQQQQEQTFQTNQCLLSGPTLLQPIRKQEDERREGASVCANSAPESALLHRVTRTSTQEQALPIHSNASETDMNLWPLGNAGDHEQVSAHHLANQHTTYEGPESEDDQDQEEAEQVETCELIEPSISSFSHGVEELLFSEFIDLQDVPMNVDESDWLKKFLPPCSMG